MTKFKKGDRVAVYALDENLKPIRIVSKVTSVNSDGSLYLDENTALAEDHDFTAVHPGQCRKLVPGKRIWVPKQWTKDSSAQMEKSNGSWLYDKPGTQVAGLFNEFVLVKKRDA